MSRYLKQALLIAMSVLLGAAIVGTIHDSDEEKAYRRGHAAGLEECQKPSRLEKAAKWLAQ